MNRPAAAPRRLAHAVLLLALAGAAPVATQAAPCREAIATAEAEAGIPPRLLLAMGRVESGRREAGTDRVEPWPWTINAEGRGSFYPSREAAVTAVRALQATGVRSIDVGCMQVNLRHHPDAFASLEEAFDPLANARYAARFLTALRERAGDWEVAAGHYHSQTPALAEGYRSRVLAALAAERAAPQPAPLAPALAVAGPRPIAPGSGAIGGGAFLFASRAEGAAIRPAAVPAAPGAIALRRLF